MFGFSGSARPSGTEIERISEKAVAPASLGSFSFGAALRLQLMRTKRSAEPILPGWKLRPLTPVQEVVLASCWSKLGELAIAVYLRPGWRTPLPPIYSKMALS